MISHIGWLCEIYIFLYAILVFGHWVWFQLWELTKQTNQNIYESKLWVLGMADILWYWKRPFCRICLTKSIYINQDDILPGRPYLCRLQKIPLPILLRSTSCPRWLKNRNFVSQIIGSVLTAPFWIDFRWSSLDNVRQTHKCFFFNRRVNHLIQ